MIKSKALQRATIVGTPLQLAMVVLGHFFPFIALHVFMFGGMAISALAGLLYTREAAAGFGPAALGGAIAGAVCALIGIAVSVLLGDTLAMILAIGTASSAVTGALGGLIGQPMAGSRSASA
jgi:hypothetical protein